MAAEEKAPLSGKYPYVSFRIRRQFKRPSADVVRQFADLYVPDISDQVGRLYTMDGTIKPMFSPAPRMVGIAVTVKCPAGDSLGLKQALQMIEPGDVVVVDAQGFTDWCLGGFHMLVRPIRERGLAGLVINGAYRSASLVRRANFPIYCRGVATASGPKRGPAEINVPVACCGVVVHPGDIVVADEDGVVVVPQDYAPAIAKRLAKRANRHQNPFGGSIQKLTAVDAERDEYFEKLFREQGGVYLD
jgi:regulator of RNase E activity RraA